MVEENVWRIAAGRFMTETEDSRNDFSSRKRAFERYRRAKEAAKKAREAREGATGMWRLQLEVELIN